MTYDTWKTRSDLDENPPEPEEEFEPEPDPEAGRFYSLTNSQGTAYDFEVRGNVVMVTMRSCCGMGTYHVPLAEARDLWRRLLARGFTEF